MISSALVLLRLPIDVGPGFARDKYIGFGAGGGVEVGVGANVDVAVTAGPDVLVAVGNDGLVADWQLRFGSCEQC